MQSDHSSKSFDLINSKSPSFNIESEEEKNIFQQESPKRQPYDIILDNPNKQSTNNQSLAQNELKLQDDVEKKDLNLRNNKTNLKYTSNPNKKNNQPKYIMKNFCKLLKDFEKYYIIDENDSIIFSKVLQDAYKFYKEKILKRNHVKLTDLQRFFGIGQIGKDIQLRQSFLNRRVLHKILRINMKKDIIQNNQLKSKKKYMIAIKCYALRLRCASLIGRIQCE